MARTVAPSATLVASPAPRDAWTAALASDPAADVTLSPAWLDCVCQADGFSDVSELYETSDGRQLIVPMARRKRWTSALPYDASPPPNWGTGGIVATGGLRAGDVAAVWPYLVERQVGRLQVRPHHLTAKVWDQVAVPAGIRVIPQEVHVMDLRGGFGEVWRRFTKSARGASRKADRSGLDVECGPGRDLAHVYVELWMEWSRRRARTRGLPPRLLRHRELRANSPRKYQTVADILGSNCRVWVARMRGRPIAAAIELRWRTRASYWRAVSDGALAFETGANNLLVRLIAESACRDDCLSLNMGESLGIASLARFKESFGARPQPFSQYVLSSRTTDEAERWRASVERRLGRVAARIYSARDG